MKITDLLKRIIDTCNYNEMAIDTDLTIEYLCMITEPLATKNVSAVNDVIISELLNHYRDSEDTNEMEYIQETIKAIMEYLAS